VQDIGASLNTNAALLPLTIGDKPLESCRSLFGALFDTSTDHVLVTDEQGGLVYINPAFSRAIHCNGEQVYGRAIVDLLPNSPALRRYHAAIIEVANTGLGKSLETIKPDPPPRQPLPLNIVISPIVGDDSRIVGTLSIGRESGSEPYIEDVEIRRREYYLRALLDNFPFSVWLKDKEGRFLAGNRILAEVAGLATTAELEGKTDFDFHPAEMAEGFQQGDRDVVQSGIPLTIIEQIKRKDGEVYWAETHKAPVVINGETIGTVGFARDLSTRKKLLQEIANRETEYSALVQSLPLAIIRYNTLCQRIFVNSYWGAERQVSVNEAMGKTPAESWSENIHSMSGEEFQARLVEVMKSGVSQTLELRGVHNGQLCAYALKLLPEYDADKQIIGAISLASDITEISQYRQRIEHLAFHDPLTDLPNRTLFNDRLLVSIGHAQRYQQQFALFLIDLDNFKAVNDTVGHATGDQLLIQAAQRLLSCVRNYDTVARMGGDEFTILVSDVPSPDDLAAMAGKIVHSLSEPFLIGDAKFFVTASIGISRYPVDSEDIDDLMKYADSAMYHAKSRGRNNYQFYAKELTSSMTERVLIDTGLRYALVKNELELYYQPCIELGTKRIIGAEALLRWHSNSLVHVGPDKFIPIAEESGLIIEIGAWVLRNAFEAASLLNKDREKPLNIAVNMSSRQFVQDDLFRVVQELLEETACQPAWITLEITESLLLQDNPSLQATLVALHSLGLGISIDDFGTGYSALGYLNKFPITQVKIDRTFVRDIATDQDAGILVKAIIAMAASLHKELVAEGVETPEQGALLQELGCIQAQGYLFGKPMPLHEFTRLCTQPTMA